MACPKKLGHPQHPATPINLSKMHTARALHSKGEVVPAINPQRAGGASPTPPGGALPHTPCPPGRRGSLRYAGDPHGTKSRSALYSTQSCLQILPAGRGGDLPHTPRRGAAPHPMPSGQARIAALRWRPARNKIQVSALHTLTARGSAWNKGAHPRLPQIQLERSHASNPDGRHCAWNKDAQSRPVPINLSERRN